MQCNSYYRIKLQGESVMPTNKTPFTLHIGNEYLQKMRYIARQETRSVSNLLEHLCRLCLEEYEETNGTIETEALWLTML